MSGDDDAAFGAAVGQFLEQLALQRLDEAFGSVLVLCNQANRRRGAGATAHAEMMVDAQRRLAAAILRALEELLRRRNAEPVRASGKAGAQPGITQPAPPPSAPVEVKGGVKDTKARPQNAEERRAALVEQNKRFKQREQERQLEKKKQEADSLRRQQEREQEDLPRLRRAAELCRLAESLRIVMTESAAAGASVAGESEQLGLKSIGLFSQLVCAGLDERFQVALGELKAHRVLASKTTGVAQGVESSEDDPYLRALSTVLRVADSIIEKLLLGEYAVAASSAQEQQDEQHLTSASASAINKLATSRIVQDVETKASAAALVVLDALWQDKRIGAWQQRAESLLSARDGPRELLLRDDEVAELDNLLYEMMDALTYCGHFTNFLKSLGVIDPASIGRGGITAKQLDIASAYTLMEQMWMVCCWAKAEELALNGGQEQQQPQQPLLSLSGLGLADEEGQDDEGAALSPAPPASRQQQQHRVSSVVEETFFIVRKAFARAIHTENGLACSATANHIYQLLAFRYSDAVTAMLDGRERLLARAASEDEHAAGEDLFAAALEGDLAGQGHLPSRLLVAINTAELSAGYLGDLAVEIRFQFEQRFPDQLPMVGMALQELAAAAERHDALRQSAIREVVESCLAPAMRNALDLAVRAQSYNLNHAAFERLEREDAFVARFREQQLERARNLNKCRSLLTQSNWCVLLALVAGEVAKAWEQALIKYQTFNELGGLRLDHDVRAMMAALSAHLDSDAGGVLEQQQQPQQQNGDELSHEQAYLLQQVRFHFARLQQMSFLVGLEKTSQVALLHYSLPPALTEKEVRAVLRRRVPPEPGVDVDRLDVKGHVAVS
jgi:hypothetical protein